jgi:hypothetical protein
MRRKRKRKRRRRMCERQRRRRRRRKNLAHPTFVVATVSSLSLCLYS